MAIERDPIPARHLFQRLCSSDRRQAGWSDLSVRVRRLALQSMLTDLHVRQLYTLRPLTAAMLILHLSYYTVVLTGIVRKLVIKVVRLR